MKQHAPATARNREPIREVLARVLPAQGLVLELAAGSGEHGVYFAAQFPALTWQPSDLDPVALASIAAWRAEAGLPNLREPLRIDVTEPSWPLDRADAVTCINMIHISPWAATDALLRGAARHLPSQGKLILYGPYLENGQAAASNLEFDASLKRRNPEWGLRELDEVTRVAASHGLHRQQVVPMPANNLTVVFVRGM